MQLGTDPSAVRQDTQRSLVAVKEWQRCAGKLISNSRSRISAGVIIGTQRRQYLRENDWVRGRVIWPLGID